MHVFVELKVEKDIWVCVKGHSSNMRGFQTLHGKANRWRIQHEVWNSESQESWENYEGESNGSL